MAASVQWEVPGPAEFDGTTFQNSYTRSFIVAVDLVSGVLPYDAADQAQRATGLPLLYSSYSLTSPYAVALKSKAAPYQFPDSLNLYKVDVEYSSAGAFDGNTGADPGDTDFGTPTDPSQMSADTSPELRIVQIHPYTVLSAISCILTDHVTHSRDRGT